MKTLSRYPILLLVLLAMLPARDVCSSNTAAAGSAVVHGHVTDVDGAPVRGAMVFAYTSPDVWRSADFISAPTDADGLFRMVMPPGKYWLVARFKRTEGFGPLMQGDKHSGDPAEIELTSPAETDMDFTVADLNDAMRMKREGMERLFKIHGKILDEKGEPVTDAYAIAYRREISRIPDFLSAWVDSQGRYTLYLPAGKYSIGAALSFPPGNNYSLQGDLVIEDDMPDVDIVIRK